MTKFEANDVTVKGTSRKGAAQVEVNGKTFWIRPSAAAALREGRVLPQVYKAFEAADSSEAVAEAEAKRQAEAKKKRPFQKVKYKHLRDISDKAIAVTTWDGGDHVLPKSQVRHWEWGVGGGGGVGLDAGDYILVPSWLVEKKGVQAAGDHIWMEV